MRMVVLFNEWLTFTLILLGIWCAIFIAKPLLRKKMMGAGVLTAPFGLTEPLFIPAYWNPPSLFNLAASTGFDLESIIFSFAIGGIGVVLYDTVFATKHAKVSHHEMLDNLHRFHKLALAAPIIVFLPLLLLTKLNPIYSSSISMFVGGIAAILCRPDLRGRTVGGGVLFLALYFAFFLSFNLAYPGFVQRVWNLAALSGALVLGVPLEELVFAFTFGMMWSGVYEHLTWSKTVGRGKTA